MSESAPRNISHEEGMVLQRQDEADPVRGPIVHLARRIKEEACKELDTPLGEELYALQISFRDQFKDPEEALRYRLYHYTLGSGIETKYDLFDTEGPDSMEEGIRRLAEKYHIA